MFAVIKKIIGAIGCCVVGVASANGFFWQVDAGPAWSYVQQGTQNIAMNADVTNQYSVTNTSTINGFFAAGSGYQWHFNRVSLDLNLTGYYVGTDTSGVNTPFVNGGSFDTLNYTVSGDSYGLLVEPKLVWNIGTTWQPYLLTGVGLALNYLSDYSETMVNSSGTAVPTSTPFNNKTTADVAYEVGVGVQGGLTSSAWGVALEYRFMGLGDAGLSTYTGQPNAQALQFGQVYANLFDLSLIGPF